MAASTSEPHAAVRFTTQLEARWQVSDTALDLPTRLSRYGLSEVVNHLLGMSPVRFCCGLA
jgi:ribosome biogenesis protein YTM1